MKIIYWGIYKTASPLSVIEIIILHASGGAVPPPVKSILVPWLFKRVIVNLSIFLLIIVDRTV